MSSKEARTANKLEVTAIVLAGGKNLRLGRNKALETIGGRRLIERVTEQVKLVSSRILIVTSKQQTSLPVADEAEVVKDLYPGKGPLGGIYTGLVASPSQANIVVACDMPFLNIALLRYMIELSRNFDAVIPRLDKGMIEPLCAVYSRNCLDVMRTALAHNHLQIMYSLERLNIRYVEREELQKFDPQLLSFFNINYEADIDKAITLLRQSGCSLTRE